MFDEVSNKFLITDIDNYRISTLYKPSRFV